MRKIVDIRPLKRELRAKYRKIRENMDPAQKKEFDEAIFKRMVASPFYRDARTLLCYVSTPIEVDTIGLIQHAFSDKKTVAVPKCLDRSGKMAFYAIQSINELKEDTFGLLEPDPSVHACVSDFSGALCILPAFAFDTEGYRIGFGKGYYDRFLQRFNGVKVGICYPSCIANKLPHGRYDVPADYVVTPKYILTIKKQEDHENG